MTIPVGSPEADALIGEAKSLLQGYAGAIIPFVRLCKIFRLEQNERRMAEIIELACNKKIHLMKHAYFYLDDDFGLVKLKDGAVKHYLKFDELYHPVSNVVVEDVDVDARVVIEFEVIG
ncbi:hypothetical protein [Pseudomonas migulae]|uniref:Uncharacterized protein n=1 Tax=Pseudomonas migulae TaxID=78543 RepID=A0ABY8MXF1_9PSED|nr:hypothetical protein [Pseudomonas migulae]WGK91723.1 hypothetical protein MOQ58_05900 [Pseudomonas migulae]